MSINKKIIKVTTEGAEKSSKQLNKVSGGLKNMAKQAGVAAAAYFGTQALLGAIKSSIDLFAKQEEAEKKLKFAAGDMTDALIDQAEALQQNTRFGDEAIIAQQAYLASLGLTEDQIKDTIDASVDLSAATGMTLESAVMNTSKTLSGMAGELGEKLGPAFRDLSIEALKAGEGIKFIADQFGGTAQADAESFSGQLDQMKNAIGDAGEALGEVFAPAIIAVAGVVTTLANAFVSLLNWQDKYDRQLDAQVKILTDVEIATMDYAKALEDMTKPEILDEMRDLGIFVENFTDAEIDAVITTGDFAESLTMLAEAGAIEAEQMQKLLDAYLSAPNAINETTSSFEVFAIQQLDRLEANNKELKQIDAFIKKYPEEAKALGLMTAAEKLNLKVKEDARNANKKFISDLELVGTKIKEFKEVAKVAAIAQAIMDMNEGAGKAFKALAGIPFIGPALGVAAEIAAFAAGAVRIKNIKEAQYGADFVTSGPQMMMVGEGSGPERVQVTPLVDPNLNGPQGQGIVVNISGNVMTDEFVEDTLVEKIRESLRLGENIGI